MGSLRTESEKSDTNEDERVQDETPPPKKQSLQNVRTGRVQLLDLSDDVLLLILRCCSPRDLKALGYTCQRLGMLICDRTLWQKVDARNQPCGRARMRWFLSYVLHTGTKQLLLSGYAREARGCLGHVNRTRKEAEEEKAQRQQNETSNGDTENNNGQIEPTASTSDGEPNGNVLFCSPRTREVVVQNQQQNQGLYPLVRQHARFYINARQLPRITLSPSWLDGENLPEEIDPETCVLDDGSCAGPQFTLTQPMLQQLSIRCPYLTYMALEYCNINCRTTGLNHFPPSLQKLSLRGSKCYNLPLEKSFLFRIHNYLPELEYLDVSECEWMAPASLLPLSKIPTLKKLYMRDCYRLSEFVAYASLSTRYGFRNLEFLDLRGSPVGDSEVSALGWLPSLEELYLSPAPKVPPWPREHSHYKDDVLATHTELEPWEVKEPRYFKIKHTFELTSDLEPALQELITQLCEEGALDLLQTSREGGTPDAMVSQMTRMVIEEIRRQTEKTKEEPNQEEVHETIEEVIEKAQEEEEEKQAPKRKVPNDNNETNNNEEPGPSPKRKKPDLDKPGPSSQRGDKSSDSDSSDDDDEDNIPLKRLCRSVNDGASTSKKEEKEEKYENVVCFSQKRDPVVIRRPVENREPRENREEPRENREEPRENREEPRQNRERPINAEPRHHVLYVNVNPERDAMYRISIEAQRAACRRIAAQNYRINVRNIFYSPPTPHMDATSLVTDTALRRFGRADGEDVTYVQIGPGVSSESTRPNRSNLRVLSVTGFWNVTDRSLIHLATAAPNLRSIDFSETSVTAQGVENFRGLRPDCEVKFSPYTEKKKEDKEDRGEE